MSISRTAYLYAHKYGVARTRTSKPNGLVDRALVRTLGMARAERFFALERAVPGCFREEMIVKTNEGGNIQGIVPRSERQAGGVFPVALVSIINRDTGKLVLFKRGRQARDMHSQFALLSGTINAGDIAANGEKPGDPLDFDLALITALRESREELSADIIGNRLNKEISFLMRKDERTTLHFFLFSISLSNDEIKRFILDNKELTGIKEYSSADLMTANDIGDALQARRDHFVSMIRRIEAGK